MAIGDVRASGGLQTHLVSDRSSEIIGNAVAGLGDSVNRLAQTGLGYLNSRTDIELVYDQRAMKSKGLELDTQFLQYQQDRGKEFTEFSRGRSATPAGMTRDYDAMVGEHEKAFLASVPPRHREEMETRLAQDRAQRVGSAFTSELSLLDTVDTNNLNTGLNTLGSALKGGTISLEDAEAEYASMLGKTSLSVETQLQFLEAGRATLQGLEFGTLVERAAMGYGSVEPASVGDIVMAGALPEERAVLNAIASTESPDYNVWNGGTTFSGYEDHPEATGTAPGASSAAGKYQFILGTWRTASASYEKATGVKVPNFSPEWQDRVALHWAEAVFNKWTKSGLTFKGALFSGDPAQLVEIRRTLGNPKIASNPNSVEWEGWADRSFGPGGAGAADRAWLEVFTGEKGIAGGGTGAADGINAWTDPRFTNLSLESKQGFANAAAAAADTQKQQMASNIRLERDAFLDQAYNAGYLNDPTITEKLKLSQHWDASAQARFNEGRNVWQAADRDSYDVRSALNAGDPLSPEQGNAWGALLGAGYFGKVADGDPATLASLARDVEKTRLFPTGSVDAFRMAMGNPETEGAALAFLASAHAGNSSILRRSGFTQDDIAEVQLYKNFALNTGSSETAMADYRRAKETAAVTGKTPAQMETEAAKAFNTVYPTSDELVEKFDGWFSASPDTKLNENTGNQLMLDASVAWQLGWKKFGTAEGAEAYMQSVLNNTWGTTQTRTFGRYIPAGRGFGLVSDEPGSKPVLMKYPPENSYMSSDGTYGTGDYGWLYAAISDFAVAGGAGANDAVLMADDQTDRDFRAGRRLTYRVIGRGEFGDAMILPGRFGGEDLDAGVTEQVTEEGNQKSSLGGVTIWRETVFDLERQLETATRFTGTPDPTQVEELTNQLAKAKQNRDTAVLAAREQGYLAGGPTDSSIETEDQVLDLAAGFQARLASDLVLGQRLGSLLNTSKIKDPQEAVVAAMVELLSKDMQIPPDLAAKAIAKMMEMN